ncbi:hypothetical protein FA15DRAFT_710560 [Coprinopsis marcescibilis]|uniref:RCC1/BLIP-II n=1 Tax=Coprinopsis marcescibilis TaxID=230819 RepID=A0A5C3KC72_COPMA|nr:hypothetical protein FA15DRAFT_710560 [Coprinopsis marcescibilis]
MPTGPAPNIRTNLDGRPRSATSTAKAIEIEISIRTPARVPGTKAGAGIVTVTSGGLHTYLLDDAGNVWSSGTNDEGALGRETKKDPSDNEPDLRANHYAVIKGLNEDELRATRLAADHTFGAALGEKGELKVWGTFRGSLPSPPTNLTLKC